MIGGYQSSYELVRRQPPNYSHVSVIASLIGGNLVEIRLFSMKQGSHMIASMFRLHETVQMSFGGIVYPDPNKWIEELHDSACLSFGMYLDEGIRQAFWSSFLSESIDLWETASVHLE